MEKSIKNTSNVNDLLNQVNNALEDIFLRKAPAMPSGVKDAIVKYGPYLTIAVLLFSLPGLLFALGVTALFAPVAYLGGVSNGIHFSFSILFLIATLVLEGLAVPGLLKRTRSGWNFLYYSVILNIVYNLVSLNILGLIVSAVISFWILFQIRSSYTK